MATQIVIPPDLQALVDKRLATGAYEDAEDVLRCALEAQEAEGASWPDEEWTEDELREVREHVEEGFQQAERGELFDEDEVKIHLAEFKARWFKERELK